MNEIFVDGVRWFTYEQLANMKSKSVRTIYLWHKSGKVESKKIDGITLYKLTNG